MEHRIEQILDQLTREEKATLTAGETLWNIGGVDRVGLPAMKVSDGPNGARGTFGGDQTAACFPCGSALAATWDKELLVRIGGELALEAASKGVSVLLAPTINIHRTPLNGRHFECLSEDPYLSGKLASAYVQGLQDGGVAACPKHYVCNDSEYQRMTLDVVVDERTLREIYLLPFEIVFKEGGAWACMAAYNQVNGEFAASSGYLLTDVLKDEWGFDGIVMSDWFGTKSTVGCFEGGLDLEMPGPGIMMGTSLLPRLEAGELNDADLDDKVRRYLRLAGRTGVLDGKTFGAETSRNEAGTRALARRAAAESFVLLKNERGALPLDANAIDNIAVIGPNARTGSLMGGGSAMVKPPYTSNPLEAIREVLGDTTEIRYAQGCANHRFCPLVEAEMVDDGSSSLTIEYFNQPDFKGRPIAIESRDSSEIFWFGHLPDGVEPGFSARVSFDFTPRDTGTYEFGLYTLGLGRLYVGGDPVVNLWEEYEQGDTFFGMGSPEKRAQCHFETGSSTKVVLEFMCMPGTPVAGLRLGVAPPLPGNAIELAANDAAEADAAIVVVGLNQDWEGEGHDRGHMDLVGEQDALVSAVAARNSRTIVVVNAGSPVHMPWIDEVAAVLFAWFPGQEFGNALTDVLWGSTNPSGRLPVTLPKHIADTPGYVNYPGEKGQVRYGEGLFVGYRHYDARNLAPLFPFGHGLSYTDFTYSNPRAEGSPHDGEQGLHVFVEVTNSGARPGAEVVQLYVGHNDSQVARAPRELKAFERIELEPGETRTVEFLLSGRDLSYYDVRAEDWRAQPGQYRLDIGASSRDIRGTVVYELDTAWPVADDGPFPLDLETPLPVVLGILGERLWEGLGPVAQAPQVRMVIGYGLSEGLSIQDVAAFVPDVLNLQVLAGFAEYLAAQSAQSDNDGQ
ncbi:MAG: glycoside hydrolase family 3 C-terminal domain-containing protein [Caldilineaceae bacterium]|nr:glycoside hydrolase family 3 C-terminal domain-containing protein [Caldilineaceae bacterium]